MKNLGILYFSSTGNSLYIAKKIKEKMEGKIIYIPTYSGNGSEFDKIIIITPIYSYGMPVPILDLFSNLNDNTQIIAILNYGGIIGGADKLFYKYALKNKLNVKSIYTMKMPENFTLVMSPPAFYRNLILRKADKRIEFIINAIEQQNYCIPKKGHTKEKTYLKNKSNWHIIGNRLKATDKCIKCKKCILLCPVQNITLSNDKIVFLDKCIACLGCFHRCPQQAIIYKNKDNKKRYINPYIDENEIGKDIK